MTIVTLQHHIWSIACVVVLCCLSRAQAGVTNSTSGGAVVATIQAAVNAANNGDTLLVSTGLYVENVRIVEKSLSLQGGYSPNFSAQISNAMATVIVPAAGISIMTLLSNESVVLEYLALTNGAAFGGGAVFCDVGVTVTARQCAIRHSAALGGGGAFLGTNCTLVLQNTPVAYNSAAFGGGIYAYTRTAHVILEGPDTDVRDNVATYGGGVCASGARVDVRANADVYGNVAVARGGGLYLERSAQGRISDSGSTVGTSNPNRATNTVAEGGGVYVDGASLVVENSAALWANHATLRGGGIYVTNGSVVVRNNAAIGYDAGVVSNYAGFIGGGICAVDSLVVVSNDARIVYGMAGFGGGVLLWNSTGIFERAVLRNNIAASGGGGMYAYLTCAVSLAACVLEGNRVIVGQGGGAMFDQSPSAMLISNTVFSSNTANIAGALAAQGCSQVALRHGCRMANNSAMYIGAAHLVVCNGLRMDDVQVISNVALQYAGMTVFNCADVDLVDCDLRDNTATNSVFGALTMMQSTGRLRTRARPAEVRGNRALSGAGITLASLSQLAFEAPTYPFTISANTAPGYGGGMWCMDNSTVTMMGAVYMLSNTAAFGGAIAATNGAVLTMLPTNGVAPVFLGNAALGNGGALHLAESSQATAVNCGFYGNTALNFGGALYSDSSILLVRGDFSDAPGAPPCTFVGNSASFGGAVYSSSARMTCMDALVASNTAASFGGGLRIANGGEAALVNCVIVRNNAPAGAGVGSGATSLLQLRHCTVSQNQSDGVTSAGGLAALTNCIVLGNSGVAVGAGNTVNYSDVEGGYPGAGNLDVNPLFANPAALDYALTRGSPCVDTGIPAGVTWDCIGAPRPMGITYDMGAYELDPAPVIFAAPTLLDFGEIVIGDAASLPVGVKNIGNSTLSGTVNFVPAPIFSAAPASYSLPVSDGTNVLITFTPPIMYAWTQTIVFASNGGSVDVTLIGAGIPEPLACAAAVVLFIAIARRLYF